MLRTLLGVLKRSGAHYHTRCFPLSAFSWVRRTVECVWQRISSPRGVAPAASAKHEISPISTTVPRLLLRTMASQCVFGFEWGFLLIVSRVVFNKVHRLLIFIFSHFIISRIRQSAKILSSYVSINLMMGRPARHIFSITLAVTWKCLWPAYSCQQMFTIFTYINQVLKSGWTHLQVLKLPPPFKPKKQITWGTSIIKKYQIVCL